MVNAGFAYNPGVPDPPNNPSFDVQDMQTNSMNIALLIETDHIGFNATNGGCHDVIHYIPQVSDPTNVPSPSIGQGYTKVITPNATVNVVDSQLFYESGQGIISQLTGNLTTTTSESDGYAWIGGVLLQWGFVSISGTSQNSTLIFKDRVAGAIPFPNNLFAVIATIVVGNGAVTTVGSTVVINNNSSVTNNLSFGYFYSSTAGSSARGFYWFAVGN